MNPRRALITVDARSIPGLAALVSGYLTVFIDEKKCEGGYVEVADTMPNRSGTELYSHPASVLPPLDAVFACGSESVGQWLAEKEWNRGERYNDNFGESAVVEPYLDLWRQEFPMFFESDIYAVLGGWHYPGQDSDWHDLLNEQLIILTLWEAEPWVEVWRLRSGEFRVIQRIT